MSKSASTESPTTSHPVYCDFADKDLQWVYDCLQSDQELARRLKMSPIDLFPVKLHASLEACTASPTLSTIIRWLPHGRAFKLYDKQRFINEVLPQFFQGNSVYASFQRQLNIYNYLKLTGDHVDKGAYYHPLMLRGRPVLSKLHLRQHETENSRVRRQFDPLTEPNFYGMAPLSDHTTLGNVNDLAMILDFHGGETCAGTLPRYIKIDTTSTPGHNSESASKGPPVPVSGKSIAPSQGSQWPVELHGDTHTGMRRGAFHSDFPLHDTTTRTALLGQSHIALQRRESGPQYVGNDLNETAHVAQVSEWSRVDGTLSASEWSLNAANAAFPSMSHQQHLSNSSFQAMQHPAHVPLVGQNAIDTHCNVAPLDFQLDEFVKGPRFHDQSSTTILGCAPTGLEKESTVDNGASLIPTDPTKAAFDRDCERLHWASGDLLYDCGSEMTEPDESKG